MKKAIKALWHGIKAVITAIVGWVSTLFGMNDNTKYARVLRHIVATAFAAVVVVCAFEYLFEVGEDVYDYVEEIFDRNDNDDDDEVYFTQRISPNICYYESYYGNDGYLMNNKGDKVLDHISWIIRPLGEDSLACYSNGYRRGYFRMRDGHEVIHPQYYHAWIFSEGLAAVEEGGVIKFLDPNGSVVIDRGFAYNEACDGYVFHRGYCAVHDSKGKKMGFIDRTGKWVIPPTYDNITTQDTFWIVSAGRRQAILTFALDTIIPLTTASFEVEDTVIEATFANHTMGRFNLQGRLIDDFQITSVEQMMYDTRELVYPDITTGEDDESYSVSPYSRQAVATCWRYEAEYGWYGLMGPDGKKLTLPSYIRIMAVDKDLYLCENENGRSVILNSKGQRVK